MNGFLNRRFWMWVFVVPAAVLGALAAIGDTVWETARLWYLTLPLLAGLGGALWYGFGPADPKPGARQDTTDIVIRLLLTVAGMAACVVGLGLIFALLSWAQDYWYVTGPVFLGFIVLIVLALWPKKTKPGKAGSGAAP
jgi:hypothetical protein